MDKEIIVSLVSATLLSVTPLLQVLAFAQAASKNVPRQEAQRSTDESRPAVALLHKPLLASRGVPWRRCRAANRRNHGPSNARAPNCR